MGDAITGRRSQRRLQKVSRNKTVEEVKAYCRANPGVPLEFGGPGAREEIPDVQMYYVPESEVTRGHPHVLSEDGDCLHVALVNAVRALCGYDAACKAQQFVQRNIIFLSSLRKLTALVSQMGCHVELRRVPRSERLDFAASPVAKWLLPGEGGLDLTL